MAVSLAQAVQRALGASSFGSGFCLRFVRTMLGVGPKFQTATRAFNATKHRHTTTPPAGVPVWWDQGRKTAKFPEGLGHVALSLGGGKIRSTDWPSKGKVGTTTIATLNRTWTKQRYRGWSEDINGVRVFTPGEVRGLMAVPSPKVSLSKVVQAARSGSKGAGVLIVQKALKREFGLDFSSGPGFFGPRTKDAYARWQRKMGFTGADADGIPGKKSLTRLGTKHNFIVVA
jgi:hypothetical protein